MNDPGTIECDAVLFDMDGVLVDTTPSVRRSWQTWADGRGLDAESVLLHAHGRPTVATVRAMRPDLDAGAEAAAIEAAQAADGEGVAAGPGAAELLARLPAERVGVVTSATRTLALARFAQVALRAPSQVVTSDEVSAPKPDPAPYLLGAERLDVAPELCVVFEDAPAGIASARAAGMTVLAVTTTHGAEDLKAADRVIGTMEGIEVAEGKTLALALHL
jgi:sugar-phosphatase